MSELSRLVDRQSGRECALSTTQSVLIQYNGGTRLVQVHTISVHRCITGVVGKLHEGRLRRSGHVSVVYIVILLVHGWRTGISQNNIDGPIHVPRRLATNGLRPGG